MASKLSSSIVDGCDCESDFYCTSCAEVNSSSDAMFYCGKCSKHYCSACEQPHAQLFRGHAVLDRSQIAQWGASRCEAGDRCKSHPDNQLELYCGNHDELLCSFCIAQKHRSCREVSNISDVAKGIKQKTEFQQLIRDLQAGKVTLANLVTHFENGNTSIRESGKTIKTTVQSIRSNINQLLDAIELNTLATVDSAVEQTTSDNQGDINACNAMYKDVDTLLNQLQSDKGCSDDRAFVGFKKGATKRAQIEELRKQTMYGSRKITFTEDKHLIQNLSSVRLLGSVEFGQALSVSKGSLFNIKGQRDRNTPRISDVFQLHDGRWLLTDTENGSIKLFDHTFKSIDVLPGYSSIKSVNQERRPDGSIFATECNGSLLMLKVQTGKLTLLQTHKLRHKCGPIVTRNDKIFISSYTELFQYDLHGTYEKRLYSDKSISNTVYRFAFSSDDRQIFISNLLRHTILTIDLQGNVLHSFSDPQLRGPSGLCLLPSGDVLVCGRDTNNILQLDKTAQRKVCAFADTSKQLKSPLSIRIDNKAQKLVVANGKNESILVLSMQ